MAIERLPTDAEIDAVLTAFDQISNHIRPSDGTINAMAWKEIYQSLSKLSEYELWLGLCNLESAMFDSESEVTTVQATLLELFQIAYERGLGIR